LLRIQRILKMALKMVRNVNALEMIARVFRQRREQLFISVMLTTLMLVIASMVMFNVENEAQPDIFSTIPERMW
jgi:voltage-gated potassium channel